MLDTRKLYTYTPSVTYSVLFMRNPENLNDKLHFLAAQLISIRGIGVLVWKHPSVSACCVHHVWIASDGFSMASSTRSTLITAIRAGVNSRVSNQSAEETHMQAPWTRCQPPQSFVPSEGCQTRRIRGLTRPTYQRTSPWPRITAN